MWIMSEFASETTPAAQEEADGYQASPDSGETLGASTPGNDALEKDPSDWVSGDDPMTGAQASYLKTLSEQAGDADAFDSNLTKAEASKRIDALKEKTGRG